MTTEPGTAVLARYADTGVVMVTHADPVIRVSVELLDTVDAPWWNGQTLVLDTAALYRYRFLRKDEGDPERVWVFERIDDGVAELPRIDP